MSDKSWGNDMSNHVGGLVVGPNDAYGRNLLVGDGIDPPLQLDEKLLEVLPPVLAVLFLAVATDVRPQSVDSLETPLVAAGTLQNDLSVMPAGRGDGNQAGPANARRFVLNPEVVAVLVKRLVALDAAVRRGRIQPADGALSLRYYIFVVEIVRSTIPAQIARPFGGGGG